MLENLKPKTIQNLQSIKQATSLIKELEKFEEWAYKDSAGITTIGYGFTSSVPSAKNIL